MRGVNKINDCGHYNPKQIYNNY